MKIRDTFLGTKKSLTDRIKEAFGGAIDDELYDNITEALILGDIPYETAEKIMEGAKNSLKRRQMSDADAVIGAVRESMLEIINNSPAFGGFEFPCILLVMGVNGVGKTTTIAKIANYYQKRGKSLMLAAADTFRAAAGEQLEIWAERLNVPIVTSVTGQDAASVIFDAISSAGARKVDMLICDTAGRLQNKKNLMEELNKLYRVCERNGGAFHTYAVIIADAMTGRSNLDQIEEFSNIKKPDTVIVTKTDGSAKGGVILAIADKFRIPVSFLGVGETPEDLVEFDAREYVNAII